MGDEREAIINYEYRANSSSGSLTRTGTRISVDTTSYRTNPPELCDYALNISHENYLDLKFIDPNNTTMIHQIHHESFGQYVLNQVNAMNPPIQEYKGINQNGGPAISYFYVPENYRSLIRGMITFINFLHDTASKSLLNGFTSQNLVVVDGTLKFWKVAFTDADSGTMLEDYKCIYEVLTTELFTGAYNKIPADMDHLFGYLPFCNSIDGGKWLKNHLTVLPSAKRLSFFKDAFDRRDHFVGVTLRTKYGNAVTSMRFRQNWYTNMFTSRPNDHFGAVMDSINHNKNHNVVYYQGTNRPNANLDLLRCCRNMTTHLKEHFQQYLQNTFVDDLQFDLVLSSVFMKPLVEFQHWLHKETILKYFI